MKDLTQSWCIMINMLRKNYSEEWRFFRRTLFRTFVVLSMLCVVTIGIGYDHYRRHPDKIGTKLSELRQYVQEHDLAGESRIKRCAKLFLNNLVASIQAVLLGIMPFLFLPTAIVIASSIPAGVLIAANEIEGVQHNFSFVVQRLLPHGIFEFASIVYASSIGVYLTIQISRKVIPKYRPNTPPFGSVFMQVAHSFLLVVVPLLLIAVAVQTFVTPK